MGYASYWYILHATIFDSTFVLFQSTQVLSVLNDSDEELDDEIVSEDFGGIKIKGDSFAQQGFADADDEKLAVIRNGSV